MSLFSGLLVIHIIAGSFSIIAAFIATFSKVQDRTHNIHIYSGQVFFWGMLIIFLTAVAMSIMKFNMPMLAISIFSFYMAFSGLRFAKNRPGRPDKQDFIASLFMLGVGAAMVLYGVLALQTSEGLSVILIVFGFIGGWAGWEDFNVHRKGGFRGKERIAQHLNRMLGGTIATITAVVVTNFYFAPAPWLLWLAPTIIITPIIAVWTRKIKRGVKRQGMTA